VFTHAVGGDGGPENRRISIKKERIMAEIKGRRAVRREQIEVMAFEVFDLDLSDDERTDMENDL
jgi:hypothetical protein